MDVITANPKTAGVARWNFFALWGARMDKGEAAALDYVTKAGLLQHTRPKSHSRHPDASLAMQTWGVLPPGMLRSFVWARMR